ncbi:MAG: hypothetical protein ACETWE_10520 [Candidatus Bathyarchaeia archaeon]
MCDVPLMRCEACGKIVVVNEGPAFKKIFGKENPTGVILRDRALYLYFARTCAVNSQ